MILINISIFDMGIYLKINVLTLQLLFEIESNTISFSRTKRLDKPKWSLALKHRN